MGFDASQLNVLVDSIGGGALRIHHYDAATVTPEEVEAPGYIVDARKRGMRVDDMVILTISGANFLAIVTAVAKSGAGTIKIEDTDEIEADVQSKASRSANLSDLSDKPAAVVNLGLGPSMTKLAALPTAVDLAYALSLKAPTTLATSSGPGLLDASGKTKLDDLPSGSDLTASLNDKAPLSSPQFSGNPRVPTADVSSKALTAASTEWVKIAVGFTNADWYRLVGDVDDTACIQRALATGLPVRITDIGRDWVVSGDLLLSAVGQVLQGPGRQKAFLKVSTTSGFTNGTVVLAAPYTEVRDIGVQFVQPDTTNPASLTTYKPAFYFAAAVHGELKRCGAYAATDAVKLSGNCGGAIIDNFHGSYFRYGFDGDGCFHTVAINNWQGYPYNMGANLVSILTGANGPQTHFRIGRVDDLKISDSLVLGGKGANFRNVDNINTTAELANVAFDSVNYGIQMDGGTVAMTGGYMSPGTAANVKFVVQTGGILNWRPAWIYPVCTSDEPTTPWIDIQSGRFSLIGCGDIDMDNDASGLSQDKPLLSMATGASVMFSSNHVQRQPGKVLTNPLIRVNGGRLTAIGNTASDNASGATFISVASDEWHRVTDNRAPGWAYSYPTAVNAVYGGNLPSDIFAAGGLDGSANLTTLANNANFALPNGNGFLVVTDDDNGNAGLVVLGGGSTVIVSQTATQFVASSSPSAGQVGIYYDNGTGRYRVKNAKGSTAHISFLALYPRDSN